jgi:predicted DNA-binding transcriptional regulator YafY
VYLGLSNPSSNPSRKIDGVRTLRFSPLKSRWIRDQVWHRDQKAKSLADGSLELTFPVADFSEIKMEILKHGDMVAVIKPKSLRELIRAEAESIAKIY